MSDSRPNAHTRAPTASRWRLLRAEGFLVVSVGTGLAFLLYGDALLSHLSQPLWRMALFAWLFVAILGSALAVVRHAEELAHRLGEPYGTLILTLAVTAIEAVSIWSLMAHGEHPATLVRDTVFAVVMLILNGLIGASLLLGGWRHREQSYNCQGANAYLGVIIPIAMLSLILPVYTQTTPGPTLTPAQESVLAVISVGLYGTFLLIQTTRHRGFFMLERGHEAHPGEAVAARAAPPVGAASPWYHALLLLVYMVPVVYLAEQLGRPLDEVLDAWGAPAAIAGVLIATLVAAPEGLSAVRAALADELQRSVNILLGSVLSTISLTIPTMLVISHFTGQHLVLGLEHGNFALLLLTLLLSIVTFGSGRTNVLQGAVHLLLFVCYLLLIFQG